MTAWGKGPRWSIAFENLLDNVPDGIVALLSAIPTDIFDARA